jgi:phytoene dehydrogenase-like protein
VIGGIRFLRNSNVEWLEKDGEKFIVGTDRGEFASNTVISSLDPFYIVEISHGELRKLRKITEGRRQGASVLTVYLSSEKVAFEGNHALYYPWMDSDDHTDPVNLANITNSTDPDEAFRNREIEITPLSMLKGFGSGCILRAGMEYEEIKCKTREEYYEVKMELAEKLAETVRHLIGDYRIVDVSTPITYEVWGGRVNGSVVGWRWDDRVPECLIKTDVDGFYIAGMYSFTIPFLGGFPTSMLSGVIAGEIANKDSSVH